MTKPLTVHRLGVVLDRVVAQLESTRSAGDPMFRAALHIMRDRALKAIAAEITAPPGLWSAKSDGARFVVEHLDGRVLSQRRGRAQKPTPIYFLTRGAAEAKARAMNDNELKGE